jgi:hypothetical protein
LGIQTLYEKNAGQAGWFGPTLDKVAEDSDLSQILAYDEANERIMVGKSKDTNPSYYLVFVTAYKDGVIPERLQSKVQKGRALAQLSDCDARTNGKENGVRERRRHEAGTA